MKRITFAILACLFIIKAFPQNNPPVAVDDIVYAVAQVPVIIDALANDYDPDGDLISINYWTSSIYGEVDTVGGQFSYKAGYVADYDIIRYKIADNRIPPLKSDEARISIFMLPNPDIPVGEKDTFDLLELVPSELDVLSNDYDPNGDELEIAELKSILYCQASINQDSSRVIVIPDLNSSGYARFKYIAREKNTSGAYVSDWTYVTLNIFPNPDIPVPVTDSANTIGGIMTMTCREML
jgi:hypothetical protein